SSGSRSSWLLLRGSTCWPDCRGGRFSERRQPSGQKPARRPKWRRATHRSLRMQTDVAPSPLPPLCIARRPVPSLLDPRGNPRPNPATPGPFVGLSFKVTTPGSLPQLERKRAEWRTGRSHEEGRLQPGQAAGDLLPTRPIARRLRKADPASHLLHEGADTLQDTLAQLSDALVERAAAAQ